MNKRLPPNTVCACLDEVGERKVEIVERCLRCGDLMDHDPTWYDDSRDAPQNDLVVFHVDCTTTNVTKRRVV